MVVQLQIISRINESNHRRRNNAHKANIETSNATLFQKPR